MPVSRRNLFGKLNLTLFKALESATAFCKLRGNPYVELVHWLHQVSQLVDSDLQKICRYYQIEADHLQEDMTAALAQLPVGAGTISDFSHHIEVAMERSWLLATLEFNQGWVRGASLVGALVQNPELRRVLISISPEFRKIPLEEQGKLSSMVLGSCEDREGAYDGSGLASVVPGEASSAIAAQVENKSVLGQYCTDLTQLARSGQIDPVIGRGHEIRTMIDILLRRRQNNPLLTGEAGVGKTAVVEGLALAVAKGEVPLALREVRLLSLDVGALLAGASMRGEFEARLKSLLEEARKSLQPVILFIDEIHTLVGAGGQAGTGDAANLLKPALARGHLRTIGATTWGEFKRHIEKDPALTRRFQVLQLLEPEEAQAIEMVRGLVPIFSSHHGVQILDEAIISAVSLSHRYIPCRQLPDKAISLLDTACARVAMSLHAPPPRIEYLRQRIRAQETELSLVQGEVAIGKDGQNRLQEIERLLHRTRDDLAEQEVAWEKELVSAELVLKARRQQAEASAVEVISQETTESESALQGPVAEITGGKIGGDILKFRELEKELADLQGEKPLVYIDVNSSVVADIVADWTGIPVGRMVKDEIIAVLELQNILQKRIVGQCLALQEICERVQTAKAQLTDPNKPVGVFLLVGPSGVGKTETALALAETLYGGEQNLITLNMSEYQEAHTVSTLKGSPPGYVGYGEGGVLTEAVRRRPYSVILLDEIEKAHFDVHEVFYQVFDKGWMEDGEGRVVDFKNTLILLTSNVGSALITQLCEDKNLVPSPSVFQDTLAQELRKTFPAAFLGRLSVIPYLPLDEQVLVEIVNLQLARVVGRIQNMHQIILNIDNLVVDHIVKECGKHETGARRLLYFIEQKILPQLAKICLESYSKSEKIKSITISIVSDDNTYELNDFLRYDVVNV